MKGGGGGGVGGRDGDRSVSHLAIPRLGFDYLLHCLAVQSAGCDTV